MMKESLGLEKPTPDFGDKVSVKIDIIRWYRRFSEYIDVGQNIVSTLAHLAEEDYHETIRSETRAIQEAVQSGKTMSDAMMEHAPTLGIPMAIGMVRAGETGGVLDHSAHIVVSWLEMEETRARVDAAYWLRTLSFMLRAGVGLLAAVQTMKSVPVSESLAELPDRLIEEIYNGGLADGFAAYPAFGDSAVALIRAGESSGTLESAMDLAAAETIQSAYEQVTLASTPIGQASPGLLDSLRLQTSAPSPEKRLGALKALEHLTTGSSLEGDIEIFIAALADSDTRLREFAAQTLERHPSHRAIPALIVAVSDAVAAVREHALLALRSADADAALKKVSSTGWDDSPDVRRAEVSVLADRETPQTISLLIYALDDPELLVARPASQALLGMGQEAFGPLLESIQSGLPNIGHIKWNTLYQMDAGIARQVVLRALSFAGLDPTVRAILLHKLAVVATTDDAPLLIQALSENPFGLQQEVFRAVGRLHLLEAVPKLISWLDHPEPWLWWSVADALANIGNASCASALAVRLEAILDGTQEANLSTQNNAVAAKLAFTISELGAREYAGLVLKTVFRRRADPEYLAPIATAVETKRMAKLLAGKDDDLAAVAARFFIALAERGEEGRSLIREAGAMKSIERAAKSDRPGVRNAAASAMRKFSELGG